MGDSLTLATIRDEVWHVFNMQHINTNWISWDYSEISGGATQRDWQAHPYSWRWPPLYFGFIQFTADFLPKSPVVRRCIDPNERQPENVNDQALVNILRRFDRTGNTTWPQNTSLMFLIMWRYCSNPISLPVSLQWRYNERNGVSNHRRFHCLLNCWFRHRSKKTSKLRVTGLCAGNSPVTGEFPAQRASNAENVSIWWRHHGQDSAWVIAVSADVLARNRCDRPCMSGHGLVAN